jgi:GMP synthase (glutamine-hydrolysing)
MRALVCETQELCPIGAFARPLEAAGIETVTWRTGVEPAPPSLAGVDALLALGGAANPDDDHRYDWLRDQRRLLREALDRGLPTLGLCLGAQLLAQVGGGQVGLLDRPAIGWVELTGTAAGGEDPLYSSLPASHWVFEWHAYGFTLPPGAELLAGTADAVQAFRLGEQAWGLQFHLEATERIIADWIGHYDSQLRGDGLDPRTLARETAGRAAAQERQAAGFGAAFVRVIKMAHEQRSRIPPRAASVGRRTQPASSPNRLRHRGSNLRRSRRARRGTP